MRVSVPGKWRRKSVALMNGNTGGSVRKKLCVVSGGHIMGSEKDLQLVRRLGIQFSAPGGSGTAQ